MVFLRKTEAVPDDPAKAAVFKAIPQYGANTAQIVWAIPDRKSLGGRTVVEVLADLVIEERVAIRHDDSPAVLRLVNALAEKARAAL
jgi:hypothetical protein